MSDGNSAAGVGWDASEYTVIGAPVDAGDKASRSVSIRLLQCNEKTKPSLIFNLVNHTDKEYGIRTYTIYGNDWDSSLSPPWNLSALLANDLELHQVKEHTGHHRNEFKTSDGWFDALHGNERVEDWTVPEREVLTDIRALAFRA